MITRMRQTRWVAAFAVALGALVPLMHIAAAVHFIVEQHRYCQQHAQLEAGVASTALAVPAATTGATRPSGLLPTHGSKDSHTPCAALAVLEATAIETQTRVVLGPSVARRDAAEPTNALVFAWRDLLTVAPKCSPPALIS